MIDIAFHVDSLVGDCEHCAKTLEEKPGLAGAASIIDLYKAIARLARIVKAAETQR